MKLEQLIKNVIICAKNTALSPSHYHKDIVVMIVANAKTYVLQSAAGSTVAWPSSTANSTTHFMLHINSPHGARNLKHQKKRGLFFPDKSTRVRAFCPDSCLINLSLHQGGKNTFRGVVL